MGFWNWVADLFGEQRSGDPRSPGATATLEPPDEAAAPTDACAANEAGDRWWAPAGATEIEAVPLAPPPMSAEARGLENLLVSYFDGHDLTMPPMPRVAEKVLTRLRNPKSSMSQVAKDIAEDQVMAADLLRMANSALYRGVDKITSLQAAVTRLGGNALRTLMMHQSLRAAMYHKKGVAPDLSDMLWQRSVASGAVMRGLAEFTGLDREDAFLIGLLHDIGNVLVLRIVFEQRHFLQHGIDVDTFEYLCFECHQEFGELIADAWKLPDALKELIGNHHAPPSADDPLAARRWMIILTDMINQMLGYDVPAAYNLIGSRPVQALNLADRSGFARFLDELPDYIQETLGSFPGRST